MARIYFKEVSKVGLQALFSIAFEATKVNFSEE